MSAASSPAAEAASPSAGIIEGSPPAMSRVPLEVAHSSEERAAIEKLKAALAEDEAFKGSTPPTFQSAASVAFFTELLAREHGDDPSALSYCIDTLDMTLLRYLRGTKLNVENAKKNYLATHAWRQKAKADAILDAEDPLEQMYQKTMPHRFHSHDREGRPVYIERTGMCSAVIPSLLKLNMVNHDCLVERHVRWQEIGANRLRMSALHHRKDVAKFVIIFDLKGLSYAPNKVAMAVFRATIDIDQSHYPERLHKLFIINAPFIFRGVWAVVQYWLDPVTKTKFHILGGDYQAKLLENIAPENLPAEYGGTCKCGDDRFDKGACVKSPRPHDHPIEENPHSDGFRSLRGPF